ncbi:flagellar biosynthesis anti-sigma factor FlgM [Kineobactrum sediminis]|uniref:Negative regulator of flagellin synthesis n=1 Tax=Kineobactrum sediminis TaxID=1905677 RepID=A0A2N5Y6H9_9GAMM|nr:flagellar biosynthesis anti-sigma factor FlgM [Kineobactrum sediminis]PLW83996.1 flagellar biosynthesis anti-sigma factor FlgM [Kineobactrum sediminis]
MPNSVNGLGTAPPQGPSRQAATPASDGQAKTATGASTADTLQLTDSARQLQQLVELAAAAETVDNARVAATRQAIADGQYTVDTRQIADNLLQFDEQLGG